MAMSLNDRGADDAPHLPSAAPISLEALARIKPGRHLKAHKSTKPANADDSTAQFPGLTLESRLNSTFTEDFPALTRLHSNPASLKTDSHPNQRQESSWMTADTSHAAQLEDGAFHQQILSNGDLSVFQWLEADKQWNYVGTIDQSEVSYFKRFYDRAFFDNHSNPETWKIYKGHVVATVKSLDANRRTTVHSGNHSSMPVPVRTASSTPALTRAYTYDLHQEGYPRLLPKERESPTRLRAITDLDGGIGSTARVSATRTPDDQSNARSGASEITHGVQNGWNINGVTVPFDATPSEMSTAGWKTHLKQNATSNGHLSELGQYHPSGSSNRFEELEAQLEQMRLRGGHPQQNTVMQTIQEIGEFKPRTTDDRSFAFPATQWKGPQRSAQLLRATESIHSASSRQYADTSFGHYEQPFRHGLPFSEANLESSLPRDRVPFRSLELDDRNHSFISERAPNHAAAQGRDVRRTVLHDPLRASSDSTPNQDHRISTNLEIGAPQVPVAVPRYPTGASSQQQRVMPKTLKELLGSSVSASPSKSKPGTANLDSELRGLPKRTTDESVQKRYESELNDFWQSGIKRLQKRAATAKKLLLQSETPSDPEVQDRMWLMMGVYETFKGYERSQNIRAAGGRDPFANFKAPPKWCVEALTSAGRTESLFEDNEWAAALQFQGTKVQTPNLRFPAARSTPARPLTSSRSWGSRVAAIPHNLTSHNPATGASLPSLPSTLDAERLR